MRQKLIGVQGLRHSFQVPAWRMGSFVALRHGEGVCHSASVEAARLTSVSVEDYLAGESLSEVRHEYVAGAVFAMAGGSEEHNILSLNLAAALRTHLRGGPCKVFIADMKVRLTVGRESVFYYPDVIIGCDPRDTDRYFKQFPKVVIEVLSPDTERTDRREKFIAYTGIETVHEYVLVAQDRMEVTVFRRADQWAPEVLTAANETLMLRSLNFSLEISVVYDGLKI